MHGTGVMRSASGAIVGGFVSVDVTRTSSTYQPSSQGAFGENQPFDQSCVTPISKEVARSRTLMRRPAYFWRLNAGRTHVPTLIDPCSPGPSPASAILLGSAV